MEEDTIQLPIIQWTWWQWTFHTFATNCIKYMRKHGKILQSKFWCITLAQDGLVNEGCFHKSYIHIGTLQMSYLLRMDLLQSVPNFSYLPHWDGKWWNRSMKDIRVLRNVCWKQGSQCIGWQSVMTSGRQWKSVEFANLLPELQNKLEMLVKFHHMHSTPLELICSTGTKWTFLW